MKSIGKTRKTLDYSPNRVKCSVLLWSGLHSVAQCSGNRAPARRHPGRHWIMPAVAQPFDFIATSSGPAQIEVCMSIDKYRGHYENIAKNSKNKKKQKKLFFYMFFFRFLQVILRFGTLWAENLQKRYCTQEIWWFLSHNRGVPYSFPHSYHIGKAKDNLRKPMNT